MHSFSIIEALEVRRFLSAAPLAGQRSTLRRAAMEKGWHRPNGKGLSAPRKVADSMEKKHADVARTAGGKRKPVEQHSCTTRDG